MSSNALEASERPSLTFGILAFVAALAIAGGGYWMLKGLKGGIHALPPLPRNGRIDLSTNSTATPSYLTDGWSIKEPGGVWSVGQRASISLPVGKAEEDIPVLIDMTAYLPSPSYVQHVRIASQGRELGSWTFDSKNPGGLLELNVPKELDRDGVLDLDFSLPDAVSPRRLNLFPDVRQLSIFLKAIEVGGGARSKSIDVLQPGSEVKLYEQTGNLPYFSSGWSARESGGVWAQEPSATLSLPIASHGRAISVTLDMLAFLPNEDYVQHIEVTAAGRTLANWTFNHADAAGKRTFTAAGKRTLTAPADALNNGVLTLQLVLPDATSPKDHNVNGDVRKLSILLRSIAVGA
jgi:hypothetical protein